MKLNNVRLIFQREVRDQLRDRRTLFMIAVLPMLLYPLLGISFFQVKQFMREHPLKVLVLGNPDIEGLPPLIEDGADGKKFAEALFPVEPARSDLLDVEPRPTTVDAPLEQLREDAKQAVQSGDFEAVILFPPDFDEQLRRYRARLSQRFEQAGDAQEPLDLPSPEIFFNTAHEKSQIANLRIAAVLERWTEAVGRQNLRDSRLPESAARPFEFGQTDVAGAGHKDAAIWSKILPFVLLVWALTGAFYPAVDLCAGEKERGTLETLLSSPAERTEIVCGKLMTIMLFSTATSLLNLFSMGITGAFVVRQLETLYPQQTPLGLPPLSALIWLVVALVPISALFSALCLALAAFARSTKEGQYYLMPLVLITMPLVILPMAPGVELNLGNSLIPVTGTVLLLRSLLEGNYLDAAPYIIPVTAVTLGCCLLAIRWAVDQFNSESVLFRGAERLDMGLWLKHLVRDREDLPSVGEAILCGIVILTARFFLSMSAMPKTFGDFAVAQTVLLVSGVAFPAVLMAIMLTRRPAKTLLLKGTHWLALPAAALLALVLHPIVQALTVIVQKLYPLDKRVNEFQGTLQELMNGAPSIWHVVLVIAVVPAICEELAFRGFILSGMRRMGHKWRAIIISAVFFGVTHLIIQQTLVATLAGVVLGYIAVQSGSLWPCILFHVANNAISLLVGNLANSEYSKWLMNSTNPEEFMYHWWVVLLGGLAAFALLQWFRRLPYAKSPEETLQDAIDQHAAHVTAA